MFRRCFARIYFFFRCGCTLGFGVCGHVPRGKVGERCARIRLFHATVGFCVAILSDFKRSDASSSEGEPCSNLSFHVPTAKRIDLRMLPAVVLSLLVTPGALTLHWPAVTSRTRTIVSCDAPPSFEVCMK